jgi:hypothetical protein
VSQMFIFGTMRYGLLVVLLLTLATDLQAQLFSGGKKRNYTVTIDDGSFSKSAPEQGATLVGTWQDGQLISLEAWYGFDYGDIRRDFYFWDSLLITVTERHRLYNAKNPGLDIDSVPTCFNAQYVFENGELTSIKQTGTYSFAEGPQDRRSMQAMYQSMAADYRKAIEEKASKKRNRKKIKNN